VRDGRYGPYVNWGKVNATLPKGVEPAAVTLEKALELIIAKGGSNGKKPKAGKAKSTKSAAKATTKKAAASKTGATKKAGASKKAAKPKKD
jgi:DNA topoisomerase-1